VRKLRTIFCGTPDFSVPTLDLLAHHPLIEIVGVVSMPDRPAGRGHELKSPEVVAYARGAHLPIVQTENINREDDVLARWEKEGIDLVIVLAFAQFLGKRVLSLPTRGCFNIHTSLLPKYRGAAPIQYALWNGDTRTGVSIQQMVKQMDAGDIVHEQPVDISPHETGGLLTTRLKFQAALACGDFLTNLHADKITPRAQDHTLATFAPTLRKADGHLDFARLDATQITNRVRAMDPWPGTYCFLDGKRLKVLRVEGSPHQLAPGKLLAQQGELHVGCASGALRLPLVQLEGKKPTSDRELLNGLRGEINLTPPPEGPP
jgi:methionyl-tRNA formyltransferase